MCTVEGMSASRAVMSFGEETAYRVGSGWITGWRAWVGECSTRWVEWISTTSLGFVSSGYIWACSSPIYTSVFGSKSGWLRRSLVVFLVATIIIRKKCSTEKIRDLMGSGKIQQKGKK